MIPLGDITEADMVKTDSRWIIPAETTLRLYVKFFSKSPGSFESTIAFDNSFSLKKTFIPVQGKT